MAKINLQYHYIGNGTLYNVPMLFKGSNFAYKRDKTIVIEINALKNESGLGLLGKPL